MSSTSSIELELFSDRKFDTIFLITILTNNGWRISDGGSKIYLPIGDIDDFDWQRSNCITDDEVIEICAIKFKNKEIIGLVLTWLDTNIGGEFLFYPDGSLSILLSINRIKNHFSNMTYFDWYLEKIIPILLKNNIYLGKVECVYIS